MGLECYLLENITRRVPRLTGALYGIMFYLLEAQLISDATAVTTVASKAPGDDGAITKERGKGMLRCLNLLHILQLILHSTAVTTVTSKAPGPRQSHHQVSQQRPVWLLGICCTFFS